jgi:insertion element IS1 protein InsB
MIIFPHCQSTKINKNGKKTNGKQSFLCNNCKKQFQLLYKNQGANPVLKVYVQRALCRNCSITDIKNIFKVSKPYILKNLVAYAKK